MPRERFDHKSILIETYRDYNGRHYIAYKPCVSQYFSDRKTLTKWLGYPVSTPTRQRLDEWLTSLEEADAARAKSRAKDDQPQDGLSDELLATGFGPEAHPEDGLDPSDPNFATRTVI